MEVILTAIAKDRPGIVEEIAAVVTEHDANWVESSMLRLGGEFAGIVQLTVPEPNKEQLINGLMALRENGITIEYKLDQLAEEISGRRAGIELTGLDHKGIVREITSMLAGLGISIDQFESSIFTASMAGEHMFHARAEIRLPDDVSLEQLQTEAEKIANDIMVDIELSVPEA